ncbi:hypothetical protein D3C79_717360 [compost metagenome]
MPPEQHPHVVRKRISNSHGLALGFVIGHCHDLEKLTGIADAQAIAIEQLKCSILMDQAECLGALPGHQQLWPGGVPFDQAPLHTCGAR